MSALSPIGFELDTYDVSLALMAAFTINDRLRSLPLDIRPGEIIAPDASGNLTFPELCRIPSTYPWTDLKIPLD